jgi:glutamate synthase domain-containing protein 3
VVAVSTNVAEAATEVAMLDLDQIGVRGVNSALRALPPGSTARLLNPAGRHNLAVGLDAPIEIVIDGTAGYYAGGLGKHATVTIEGTAGTGVGENLMSGVVHVRGNASQSAAASAHGGTVRVDGSASMRAGISLKGATLVVAGDVGPFCGFMAQAGTILIGGDAGHDLGDSLYEAVIYVAGRVASLGTDAETQELSAYDVERVRELATTCELDINPENVTRIGSARRLYHFATHNSGAY